MILGVAGKVASGKSVALDMLSRHGFLVLDADKIVHDLYKNGEEGQKLIESNFGIGYILNDGDVNRRLLGKLVFSDKKKLMELNKLIHPLVYKYIHKAIEKAKLQNKNMAIEAAYFDEDYVGELVDKILLIERSLDDIMKIMIEDRGYVDKMAKTIISVFKRPNRVDFLVKNNGSLEDFEKELLKLF